MAGGPEQRRRCEDHRRQWQRREADLLEIQQEAVSAITEPAERPGERQRGGEGAKADTTPELRRRRARRDVRVRELGATADTLREGHDRGMFA